MKLRNLIIVLALVTAFSTALFFQREDTAPTITSSPPLVDKPVARSSAEMLPKLMDTPSVDWVAIKERMDKYIIGGDNSFTREEEEAFNARHVLPLNWPIYVDCVIGHYCEFQMKYPPHAYESIDKAELQELAYADPLAALMMGLRFGEEWTAETAPMMQADFSLLPKSHNDRIDWYLRAAALSDKTGPLMRLVGVGREGHGGNEWRYGIPEPAKKIALLHVAHRLGDPRGAKWRDEIDSELERIRGWSQTESQFDEESADFKEAVDYLYQDYMAYMDSIQKAVTSNIQVNEFAVPRENPDA